MPTPEASGERPEVAIALRRLLLSLFSVDELLGFIRDHYPEIWNALPLIGATPETIAAEVVVALMRRNLINERLFQRLQDARPFRRSQLLDHAAICGLPQNNIPPSIGADLQQREAQEPGWRKSHFCLEIKIGAFKLALRIAFLLIVCFSQPSAPIEVLGMQPPASTAQALEEPLPSSFKEHTGGDQTNTPCQGCQVEPSVAAEVPDSTAPSAATRAYNDTKPHTRGATARDVRRIAKKCAAPLLEKDLRITITMSIGISGRMDKVFVTSRSLHLQKCLDNSLRTLHFERGPRTVEINLP